MEGSTGRPAGGGRKFTKEVLAPVIAECCSFVEVCRRLGVRDNGGTPSLIARYAKEYGLDTSHMVGRAHGRGVWNRRSPSEILVVRRTRREEPRRLRRAMIEVGIPYVCFGCGNAGQWMGRPLPLDIDHIDGDGLNNLQDNLRFACPNCHRQTETWGRV